MKTKIRSYLGGNLRIRSYIPLKGKGLVTAKHENINPFYVSSSIKQPLVAKGLTPQYPVLYKTYEYDIMTEAGEIYEFERSE